MAQSANAVQSLALTVMLAVAGAPTMAASGPPRIGAASLWTDGPTLVHGKDLDGEQRQHVYTPPRGEPKWTDADLKASLERVLAGKAQAPPAPGPKTRWQRTTGDDPYTACVHVGRVRGRPAVLHLRNAKGRSAPYLLNAPEIWGVNPAKASAGQAVTVWGVNLGMKYGLVSAHGKVSAIIQGYRGYNGHSGRYELRFYNLFLVPPGTTPGTYRLYNWAGLGDAGWSGSQELKIVARPRAPAVFNVRDFGAKGNGVADDTAAIRKAMAKAGAAGGGRVYLPSGRYAITRTLTVPARVTLCGESRDSTRIETSRFAPFTSPFPADALLKPPPDKLKHMTIKGKKYIARTGYPVDWLPELDERSVMVRIQDRCRLEELTFDVGPARRIRMIVLVGGQAGALCEDVVIDRCRFLSASTGLYGKWPHFYRSEGVYVVSPLRYFRLDRNEFVTNTAAITFLPAKHTDGSISFNRIVPPDPHIGFVALGCGGERNLIQGNLFENTGRGKTGGAVYYSPRPVWRNCYLHNIFRNLRKSDGEMLLYETGVGTAWGTATGAGPRSLEAKPDEPWKPDQWKDHRVLICAGCGTGQMRWIVGNTSGALTIDQPWRVVPDATSKFCVLRGEVLENLHIGNEYFFSHQWSGIFGAAVRNVWVNAVMESVSGGHYLWKIHGVRQQSLNVHLGGRYHERGRLAIINNRYKGRYKPLEVDLPMVFGNEVRHCAFRRPSYVTMQNCPDGGVGTARGKIAVGTGCPLTPIPGEEPGLGLYDSTYHPSRTNPDDPKLDTLPVSTRWNLLADNLFMQCPVGIRIGRRVAHTVLWDNTYYDCTMPVRDSGIGTRETGAKYRKAFGMKLKN